MPLKHKQKIYVYIIGILVTILYLNQLRIDKISLLLKLQETQRTHTVPITVHPVKNDATTSPVSIMEGRGDVQQDDVHGNTDESKGTDDEHDSIIDQDDAKDVSTATSTVQNDIQEDEQQQQQETNDGDVQQDDVHSNTDESKGTDDKQNDAIPSPVGIIEGRGDAQDDVPANIDESKGRDDEHDSTIDQDDAKIVSTATSTVQNDIQEDEQQQETNDGPVQTKKSTEFIKEYIDTRLDATDRIKNVVASRLRVMEASPDIIEQMKKIDISIVISHCEAPLSWILGYIGEDYSIKDITIYSKCGNEVSDIPMLKQLSPTVNVIALPNVGRCDHTYAYYIREHYRSIEKEESNGDDIVLFLKDNSRFLDTYPASDVIFSYVSGSGFACLTPPRYCLPGEDPNLYDVTMQHSRVTLLKEFTLPIYSRTDRETNEAFLTDKYTSLENWTEEMGFIIPESETIPVCYNGMFAAQKKQFLNQPEEAWENMVESLSRADNLMEGHYAERMWASILSDVDEESAKAVDEVLSPHIGFISIRGKYWALKGQVYIMKNMTALI